MRDSAIDNDHVKGMLASFRRDGFLVVPDLFARGRTDELLAQLKVHYPDYLGGELPADHFHVGERRFNAPLRFAPPIDCADLATQPLLDVLLGSILGQDYVFEALGLISSLPGAPDQHVHRDGGELFADAGLDGMLPASAVTVVIPLVDMDQTSGRTMFWPGSQRAAKFDKEQSGVAPEVSAGSLILWDYRIYHGGLANHGDAARPLIYLTACRPFWIDHRNYIPGKNAKLLASRASLDALDDPARARFIRADASD